MKSYDVAVVGAGLLGCFTARNLRKYNLSVALLEKRTDVCLGISKANTAVVYAGYDNRPGSLKARMCVSGNKNFDNLCRDLDVRFDRTGSLMLSYGNNGDEALKRKLSHGLENGVEGLRIISPEEAREMENGLGEGITSALFAPSTGTVNPWQLGIAAFENARDNGAEVYFGAEVLAYENNVVKLKDGEELSARMLVDATGLNAGRLSSSRYFSVPDSADYLIMDRQSVNAPSHVLFEQSEEKCRGITVVPTTDGNILAGPSNRKVVSESYCDSGEIEKILEVLHKVIPGYQAEIIRTFAGLRPNVETSDGEDIHDFVIETKNDVISLIGIKTPGLTCSDELGKYVAEICANRIGAGINSRFIPVRRNIEKVSLLSEEERDALIRKNGDYGEIVCRCEEITKAEIIEAIRRGASDVEGVKHRCGAVMGRCQGSRCSQIILEILREYGHA